VIYLSFSFLGHWYIMDSKWYKYKNIVANFNIKLVIVVSYTIFYNLMAENGQGKRVYNKNKKIMTLSQKDRESLTII
jgi:hypothetical protein